jgi:hypothetical protein
MGLYEIGCTLVELFFFGIVIFDLITIDSDDKADKNKCSK